MAGVILYCRAFFSGSDEHPNRGKKAEKIAKGGAVARKDYRIYVGYSSDGVALSWVVRARTGLEAIQRSRQWFEERLLSDGGPIQIDVYDAQNGIERDNPEVPAAFQIEVDPERFTPEHIRIRDDPISE